MWEKLKTLMYMGRAPLVVMSVVGLLLIACQAEPATQVEDTDTEAPAESVGVVYQLQQEFPLTIQVTSTSIKPTGFMLKDFTCDGGDSSPHLDWTGVPSNTQSIVVVAEDIDAEEGTFAHWLMWGVPSDIRELAAGVSGSPDLPSGAVEGVNGFTTAGWKGPCPPPRVIGFGGSSMGQTATNVNSGVISHRYVFNVYALDKEVSLGSSATRSVLLQDIDGHIVAGGAFETKYLSATVIRK